jgi:hypothetical protein
VVLIGPVDGDDRKFLRDFQTQLGCEPVLLVDSPEEIKKLTATPAVRKRLGELLKAVFPDSTPVLTVEMLNARPNPSRFSDDYKIEVIHAIGAFCRLGAFETDTPKVSDYFRAQLDRSYTAPDVQFVVNYLFRTFLYAAVASTHFGTVVADGLRKHMLSLIESRQGRLAPLTLAVKLYRIADLAFRTANRAVLLQSQYFPLAPLLVAYLCAGVDDRSRIASRIRAVRSALEPYRKKMADFQSRLTDDRLALGQRTKLHNELLGSGAAYLEMIVGELRLPAGLGFDYWDKFWLHAVDSVAGSASMKATDTLSVQAEFKTALPLAILRAARQAWAEQKHENAISELVRVVADVLKADGVMRDVEQLFPIIEQRDGLVRTHEESLFAASMAVAG